VPVIEPPSQYFTYLLRNSSLDEQPKQYRIPIQIRSVGEEKSLSGKRYAAAQFAHAVLLGSPLV
jgi:hypothetical protein